LIFVTAEDSAEGIGLGQWNRIPARVTLLRILGNRAESPHVRSTGANLYAIGLSNGILYFPNERSAKKSENAKQVPDFGREKSIPSAAECS
jgi:hypothetical protein